MSSEDLTGQFWMKDAELHFTASETRMFFALVKMVGSGELVMSDAEIAAKVGVCMATMRKCRARLSGAGLIVVAAGNGRGCKTAYILPCKGDDVPQPVKPEASEQTEAPELGQCTESEEHVQEAVPPPTEEVKPKCTRVVKPKGGDLFGMKDMRPKRTTSTEVEPPDIEEVAAHFLAQKVPRDVAETFYYHYDSLGWMTNSGVKVKRWQSLANKWITKEKKEQNYGSNSNQTGDTFKRSIAERVARAEREYREAVGH